MSSGAVPGMPDMDMVRHQIDVITAQLPERMSKTQIATLGAALQIEGMALALSMPEVLAASKAPDGLVEMAQALKAFADELMSFVA